MAAAIDEALGLEVDLEVGNRGEFTLWVDDEIVARKTLDGFPDEQACIDAVRATLRL